MRTALRTALTAVVAAGPLLGCQPTDAPSVTPDAEQVERAQVRAAPSVDTTAEAIHAYLQSEDYRANWSIWPGLDPYYGGSAPHGRLLTTYVNDPAQQGLQAMEDGEADDLPFGAIVVKENFMPDSSLAAVTVMYKHEGYNPSHNDWFWVKRLADGTVEASGRVETCIGCHADEGGSDHDYLRTAAEMAGG